MLQPTQLHEDEFLRVLWDEELLVIGIDWKEATAAMTDKDFRAELTLFVGYVEEKKARGILVDVSKFRHQMAADAQQWRVKNISTRHDAAGIKRFAFLFPKNAQIPPMMKQSSPGESFLTQADSGLPTNPCRLALCKSHFPLSLSA